MLRHLVVYYLLIFLNIRLKIEKEFILLNREIRTNEIQKITIKIIVIE